MNTVYETRRSAKRYVFDSIQIRILIGQIPKAVWARANRFVQEFEGVQAMEPGPQKVIEQTRMARKGRSFLTMLRVSNKVALPAME